MSSSNHSEYSLKNKDNYNKILDADTNTVLKKYIDLQIEYIKFIYDIIETKNIIYTKFIIIRGMETITNVFNKLLYFTKNIGLTYFHCQKSFYFYVEFIGQISVEQNSYLQLTSRDASTYVYKKSIFELDDEYIKNTEVITDENKNKLDLIVELQNIYKIILEKIINTSFEKNENYIKNKINEFDKICLKMINLKLEKNDLLIIKSFIRLLDLYLVDINKFLEILILFLKKINKNYSIQKINEKYIHDDFKINLIENNTDKFLTWLFT